MKSFKPAKSCESRDLNRGMSSKSFTAKKWRDMRVLQHLEDP